MTEQTLRRDSGVAMIMVLGMISVMTLIVAATVAYAVNVAPQVRRDENWQAALAAAQAGVDDYLAKLNRTDAYALSVDCDNEALQGPQAETNACGWNDETPPGWVDVQAGVSSAGQFHYDVNTSSFWKDGSVWVESTGRVRGVSRTLQVRVARGGSTDFLYYTDFEDADPQNVVAYPIGASNSLSTGGARYDACREGGLTPPTYWWQDGKRVTNDQCAEIQFSRYDVLNGDVHFNDTPLMDGTVSSRPRFLKGFEVADPKCTEAAGRPDANGVGTNAGKGKCWRDRSTTNPYVGPAGARPAGELYLPDNSEKFSTYPGCNYYGDTRIRFNSNGTMTVWNTQSAGRALTGPGSPAGLNCGDASQFVPAPGQKYPASGQTVPVPDDLVIYVQSASSGSSRCVPGQIVNGASSGSSSADQIPKGTGSQFWDVSDISFYNPWSSTDPSRANYDRGTVRQDTDKRWTLTTNGWTLDDGYPMEKPEAPVSPTVDVHPTTFDCGLGNVYVEGTVSGSLTIAAQNNVILTGNLLLSTTTAGNNPTGSDMIGLVAGNSVVVYHPVSRNIQSESLGDWVETSNTSKASCRTDGTASGTPNVGTKITCTQTYQRTFGPTYSNLTHPGVTGSSGTRWTYASIQALRRSFWVQNYNRGADLGTLAVRGSIAQKWRGAVGTSGGTGFDKDYSYDARLQFASPPYFPQWVNAAWGSKVTGELPAKY